MASLDITTQSDTPLDDLERELVREILGINGRAGDAVYVESDVRMALLTPQQCQMVRKIINIDYPDVDLDTTKVFGGSDGLDYNPDRTLKGIRQKLRRMLYPVAVIHDPTLSDADTRSDISIVPVVYGSGTTEFD